MTASDLGVNVIVEKVGSLSAINAASFRNAGVESEATRAIDWLSLIKGTVCAPAACTTEAARNASINWLDKMVGTVKPPADSVPLESARRSTSVFAPVAMLLKYRPKDRPS